MALVSMNGSCHRCQLQVDAVSSHVSCHRFLGRSHGTGVQGGVMAPVCMNGSCHRCDPQSHGTSVYESWHKCV